jgi:hypothetical protein
MTFRKLSVLAVAALLITGVSGLSTVAGTPKTVTPTTTSLTSLITSLINSVGDDTFSIIDLTTLVSTFTSTLPMQHYTAAQVSPSSSGTSTQHYGPYASGSTDSGTCGNDWANDSFDRHFTVFQDNNDGSLLVVEQFRDGNFVTPASDSPSTNFSPGGCPGNPPSSPQGVVSNGVTGSLHGYFVIPLPSGTFQSSFDSSCVSGSPSTPCTTTGFINSHFSPACYPTTCTVTTFFFHYAAGGQGLIINEWKNASSDRGGNNGDIRSANFP